MCSGTTTMSPRCGRRKAGSRILWSRLLRPTTLRTPLTAEMVSGLSPWIPTCVCISGLIHALNKVSTSIAGYTCVIGPETRLLSMYWNWTIFSHSANYYNYINMTQLDPSGMFRFLTDELQAAEDAGDRGMYYALIVLENLSLITLTFSVDPRTRSHWLGWH